MFAQTVFVALLAVAPALAAPSPAPEPEPIRVPVSHEASKVPIRNIFSHIRTGLQNYPVQRNRPSPLNLFPPVSPSWSRSSPLWSPGLLPASPRFTFRTPLSAGFSPRTRIGLQRPYMSPTTMSAYVRRSAIPNPTTPSGQLSPGAGSRSLTSLTPLSDLTTSERAKLGSTGGPAVAHPYMRTGKHYKQRKAGAKNHQHSSSEWVQLEQMLEDAERLVNSFEGQLNKPQTVFPELVAQTTREQKIRRITNRLAAQAAARARANHYARTGATEPLTPPN